MTTTIQKMALTRALSMLRAAGCKFKVIEDDGTEHGELIVAPPPKLTKRGLPRYGRGTLMAHFKPYTDAMQVDDVVTVPYGPFADSDEARECLRGALCGHLSQTWGVGGTYMTHCNEVGIDVARFA